jgi:hypothetical protein
MKKILLLITLFITTHCLAQQQLAFPFQGGNLAMMQFFRDSLKLSDGIKHIKASGTVVFKFSADEQGNLKNLVIYYADDAILVPPIIDAMKKSTRKWIIPDKEKLHDFVIPFMIKYNPSDKDDRETHKAMYNYYAKRKPITSHDQIPLNLATLLPTVTVSYGATQ